jgi:HTH-type transcriptional regulator/antitoxin HigA
MARYQHTGQSAGFLMEQHGLRQCDLPEVGAQSVVSDELTGKRALNLRQVQALAQRFGVPMDVLFV